MALIATVLGLAPAPSAASPWNTPSPAGGAQAGDPSESGTDGLREDEPDSRRQDDGSGEQDGAGGREALPPGDDFGCPIRDQESFEMII